MSSVTSVKSGVSDLLQAFAGTSLSTPGLQAALQNAAPADLVQLNAQALQLQQVNSLFGDSGGSGPSGTSTDPGTLLLQALANQAASATSSQSSTSSPTSSAATSYAATAGSFALQEASDLFGTGSGNSSISLLG